jgi:hypothetical protein
MTATLTPAAAAAWLFGSFFLLMILRVPIAFALGLACLPVLIIEPRLSPMVVFTRRSRPTTRSSCSRCRSSCSPRTS